MATDSPQTSYDEVPYPIYAFEQTHPDRLHVIGRLLGMDPAPVEHCRVLELGCAQGGNLIPMAEALPESEFVGIDLSRTQVEVGQNLIEEVGLTNITLHHADILEFDPGEEKFDYLIAHGVFSWVPEKVRDRMLQLCRDHLKPQGIAYLSYNTKPGWMMRGMIRDLLTFHAGKFSDPGTRIQQARAILTFLSNSVSAEDNPYGAFLQSELDRMERSSDNYVLHDHLEKENRAFYFHEFAELAANHHLQYLGEAEFSSMLASNFGPEVKEQLEKIQHDLLATEQYMDFLKNRTFRQTLLCHREVRLNRNVDPALARDFDLTTSSRLTAMDFDPMPDVPVSFRRSDGREITTKHPGVKAILRKLGESFPHAVPFDQVVQEVQETLPDRAFTMTVPPPEVFEKGLCQEIMKGYGAGVLGYRSYRPSVAQNPGSHPKTTRLTQVEARKGLPITNRFHQMVLVDLLGRAILPYLDGTKTIPELTELLVARHYSGEYRLMEEEEIESDPEAFTRIVLAHVEEALGELVRLGCVID